MKPLSTLIAAVALPLAFAAPALAAAPGQTLGTVVNGNTIIEFRAADTGDIDLTKLSAWSNFAAEHPNIARELAYKPSLINSDSYLKKHPELESFFSAHPDIRMAMAENPGNYVAIPPRPGE
jgi:hypothetical protein